MQIEAKTLRAGKTVDLSSLDIVKVLDFYISNVQAFSTSSPSPLTLI
jgi:hypothetical protein